MMLLLLCCWCCVQGGDRFKRKQETVSHIPKVVQILVISTSKHLFCFFFDWAHCFATIDINFLAYTRSCKVFIFFLFFWRTSSIQCYECWYRFFVLSFSTVRLHFRRLNCRFARLFTGTGPRHNQIPGVMLCNVLNDSLSLFFSSTDDTNPLYLFVWTLIKWSVVMFNLFTSIRFSRWKF